MVRTALRRAITLLVVLFGFLTLPGLTSSSPHSALDILRNSVRTTPTTNPDASRPVDIEYFDAHPIYSGMKILWCVFSDKDVDGFRIYRMADNSTDLSVVNRRGLIPAWQQNYLDGDLAPSTTYRYLLGVVFDDGSEVFSQPVEAKSSQSANGLAVTISCGLDR
jgi:hypothetical protein